MAFTDDVGFQASTTPHRGELVLHCYRLLGSVDEAEDLVQDTLLRAWRARDSYDPDRASVRTWLYRIATNACLSALSGRKRRPLPSGIVPASGDPTAALVPDLETPWLQPLPDHYLDGDPGDRAAARESVRLALLAALQLLPARQRAALLLRDVLGFSAREVAEQLATTPAAVNSALQRARAALAESAPESAALRPPDDAGVRAAVERYAAAFEAADVPALVALLTDDVVLEMPPIPLWYLGSDHYGRFITHVFARRGTGWALVPTTANGQPALAAYCPAPSGGLRPHSLQVLSVRGDRVSRNVTYADPRVLRAFQLDRRIPDLHGR